MDNADLLSHSRLQQESTEQFQAERDFPLTCHDDGSRKTELFSDYQPGPSHSLAPVVMQNAKHNPGLSTATTEEFRESESTQRTSDLLPLQPAPPIIDHGRSRGRTGRPQTDTGVVLSQYPQDQTAQQTPGLAEAEEEAEQDFLLEVKMEEEEEQPEPLELQEIIDMSSFTDGIYICEVCKKDKTTYYNLASHRVRVHKLPYRQDRLGPNGEISSYVLHAEQKKYAPDLPRSIYICEACRKDCHNYNNLGAHRRSCHKLPFRQVNLGENGEYLSADLHQSARFHSMGGDDSIYVCEVCRRDYKCYRSLGDHRRHFHKLPFRQERLGNRGELSSHDLHPELKNVKASTEDSVYVCEVCKNDYKTYTKLKYHRKHTHKIQARQDTLGLNGDIPTESLHPLPRYQAVRSPRLEKQPRLELELEPGDKPCQETVYVCEVCRKTYKSYRHLGDHRRSTHRLPFRQTMLGSNFDISSFQLHPGNTSCSSASSDSVYVCEVCKIDYKSYTRLKYHRKHTHKLPPRQARLGLKGDILTDILHPLPGSRRRSKSPDPPPSVSEVAGGGEPETDPLLEVDLIVKEETESRHDIYIKSEPAD